MAYNVFISWSKDRAKIVAAKLHEFLPEVIQAARPWFSPDDITKGKQWRAEIHNALDQIKLAIVVVTPENQNERWIHYEAGVMAASLKQAETLICPYLIDIEHKDLQSPVADFNVTAATKEDTLKMVLALASRLDADLEEARLRKQFDRVWPELEQGIADAISAKPHATSPKKRSDADVLNELTQLVRDMHRRIVTENETRPPRYRDDAIGKKWPDRHLLSPDDLKLLVSSGTLSAETLLDEVSATELAHLIKLARRDRRLGSKSDRGDGPNTKVTIVHAGRDDAREDGKS